VAEANALNTAELGVELPAGATFTSSSGVFLTPPTAPTIALAVEGGELVISFDGVLEVSTGLREGGWSPVEGAVSPHRLAPPLAGTQFFRARAP
jgi:hypothetical protein